MAALAVIVLPGVTFAQSMSTAQLQAEIQSLTAQLQSLETQLAAGGGSTAAWCYTFNSNLSIGMTGNAVTQLQTALQKDGESVTITGTFDDQTASAVTAFQEKYQTQILAPYGLSYGTGYAGKSTRAELNSLFGCGTINPKPTPSPAPVNPSPAMSVYQNSQYGVQFSYPSNYTVKYGNAAFGTSNNQLGDYGIGMENSNLTPLVTIEMPSNSYPDTDFEGAYLNVSVGTQMTSSQCSAMNTAGSSPSNGIKTIGGVPFNWSVMGSAAAGTDYTDGSFSGYTNGTCYVLLAGGVVGSGGIGATGSDGATITAVDSNSVLAALNSVLATMTFSAPTNPPVTCPAWGCGNPPIATGTAWAAPSIYPLNPSSGPLGTMITITGSGFKNGNAFVGDSDSIVWITNGSQKGVLAAYQPQTDSTMTVGTPYSVCQTNNVYSGAPCPLSMILAPGNYSIYIVNGNGTSNSEPFMVTATANLPVFSLSPSSGPVGTITTLSSTNSQCGALNQCTYVWLQNGSTVATNAQWASPNQIQVPTSCAPGICDLGIWNPTQTLESEVPFTVIAPVTICPAWGCNGPILTPIPMSTPLTISQSKISGMDSAPVVPGEGGVDLLNVDLTAGASSNVTVNTINVSCGGLVCANAVANLRLAEVAVNGQGISAQDWTGSTSNFQLFTPNLVIPASTTVTMALYADIPSNAPVGQQMQWSLTPGGGLVTITPTGNISGSAQGNLLNITAAQ